MSVPIARKPLLGVNISAADYQPMLTPAAIRILGSSVHLVSAHSAVALIHAWIQQRDAVPKQVVVTGFHGLWEAYRDPHFKRVLARADLWVPDGIAPVWVARIRGHRAVQRVPGAELMQEFFILANQYGYRSFFYGDTDQTLALLKANLVARYPRHTVAGVFSPPFRPLSSAEDDAFIRQINEARPDVLWVGLGLPKQERWIFEHRDRLKVPVVVGVGAAFGFLSGRVQRCPDWIGRLGFEWAYRFAMEPRKLWRRDLLQGPRFLFHVFIELVGLRKYN